MCIKIRKEERIRSYLLLVSFLKKKKLAEKYLIGNLKHDVMNASLQNAWQVW